MSKRQLAVALAVCVGAATAPAAADTSTYSAWIAEMKAAERGPFSQIRWFCADGSVLPPRPYACAERGGGPPARPVEREDRGPARQGLPRRQRPRRHRRRGRGRAARLPRRARAAPRREVPRRGGRRLDLPPCAVLPWGDPGGGRAGGGARSPARDGGEPRLDRPPLRRRCARPRACCPTARRRPPSRRCGRRRRPSRTPTPASRRCGRRSTGRRRRPTPAACASTRRRPGPTCARGTRRSPPRSTPPTRPVPLVDTLERRRRQRCAARRGARPAAGGGARVRAGGLGRAAARGHGGDPRRAAGLGRPRPGRVATGCGSWT